LNWDISDAMLTVNELMLSPDGMVFEPCATLEVDVLDDDPQPEATRPTTAARLNKPTRRKPGAAPWTRERGCRPSVLFSNCISDPFRRNLSSLAPLRCRERSLVMTTPSGASHSSI
jgi:hypothetical protein